MNTLQKQLLKFFMAGHVSIFRMSNGKIGGVMGGMSILLLTTTGRKTGIARTKPLAYIADGDDYVICASAAGAPKHPAWFLNLKANPNVTVEVGPDKFQAQALEASPKERERLWPKFVALGPFEEYQKKTERIIPLIILRKDQ